MGSGRQRRALFGRKYRFDWLPTGTRYFSVCLTEISAVRRQPVAGNAIEARRYREWLIGQARVGRGRRGAENVDGARHQMGFAVGAALAAWSPMPGGLPTTWRQRRS